MTYGHAYGGDHELQNFDRSNFAGDLTDHPATNSGDVTGGKQRFAADGVWRMRQGSRRNGKKAAS